MLQKVCGTLDHCFITTHSIHKESDLQICFGVIFCETRHHAQAHITSGALAHCALSLAVRRTQRWEHSWVDDFAGHCLLWRLLSHKTYFAPALGLAANLGVGQSWLFPASTVKFLTRRTLKSRWVYLTPCENNRIYLLSIANNYNDLPYLFSSV